MDQFDQFELDKMRWTPRSNPNKGPMRMCKFCFLGVAVPMMLLCVPLYMRFISLRPHLFHLSPLDMKLLNYEHRVSTIWCSKQTLRMNSTFNAYLLPEKPKLQRKRKRVQMERKILNLEDDMKEYWGFFLLLDSTFRLRTCSRHEGASVVVIKHSKNVAKCAWLGELDSAEESDEMSSEFDFHREVLGQTGDDEDQQETFSDDKVKEKSDKDDEKTLLSTNSKEMPAYISIAEKWSLQSKRTLVKHLLEQIIVDRNESKEFEMFKNILPKSDPEPPKLSHLKVEDVEDVAAEDVGAEDIKDAGGEKLKMIDHFLNKGRFNQKNQDKNKEDKSNEEGRSSWSSSEEALATCEGAMFNIALDGSPACNENATFDQMEPIMKNLSHDADSTGFYYFVFTNENEITSNFIAAHFDLQKTVFDVREHEESCVNTTDCSLHLAFYSHQHVVLEVPQNEAGSCDYEAEGLTSYQQCNTIITAESVCEPRGSIYFLFLLLVPVFILMFAYV